MAEDGVPTQQHRGRRWPAQGRPVARAEAKRWPTREATSTSLVAARGMSRSGVLVLVLAVEVRSGRRGAGAPRGKESCAWAVARRGSVGSRARHSPPDGRRPPSADPRPPGRLPMAPLSCRDLPARLPTLPRRATAHAQLSFLRAPAPRRPLITSTASTSAGTLWLPLTATRDEEVVASPVGHLEPHDVAHGHQYCDDVQQEEEEDDGDDAQICFFLFFLHTNFFGCTFFVSFIL